MKIDFLPKHLDNNIKIEKQKEVPTGWKYFFPLFKKSWTFKILIYFVLPCVILNFWILRYDDFFNGCHIKIQFSLLNWNNLEIKKAIQFIKRKQPDDYEKICRYVKNIDLYLPCSFSAAGCFRNNSPGTIGVYTYQHDENNDPSYTAAIIVHETCHAIQYDEGRINGDRETECYREDQRFFREIGVKNIFPTR